VRTLSLPLSLSHSHSLSPSYKHSAAPSQPRCVTNRTLDTIQRRHQAQVNTRQSRYSRTCPCYLRGNVQGRLAGCRLRLLFGRACCWLSTDSSVSSHCSSVRAVPKLSQIGGAPKVHLHPKYNITASKQHCVYHIACIFYRCSEHRSCHGMSRWLQAVHAILLPSSV